MLKEHAWHVWMLWWCCVFVVAMLWWCCVFVVAMLWWCYGDVMVMLLRCSVTDRILFGHMSNVVWLSVNSSSDWWMFLSHVKYCVFIVAMSCDWVWIFPQIDECFCHMSNVVWLSVNISSDWWMFLSHVKYCVFIVAMSCDWQQMVRPLSHWPA